MRTKKAQIDLIVKHYLRLQEVTEKANEAGVWNHDGPLDDAVWRAFDALLGLYDPTGWISWYIYDNDCGEARKLVRYHTHLGRPKRMNIGSTLQLAKLMVNEEYIGDSLQAHKP